MLESLGLHFSEIIIKIQGYILFVLGNTLVWIKYFNLVFFNYIFAWVKPFPMDKSIYVLLNMWVIEHNILFPNGLSLTKGK